MTAQEHSERRDREALPSSSVGGAPCTNPDCALVLRLAWDKIERLEKELARVQAELDRVRNELAYTRAVNRHVGPGPP